MHAIMNQDDAIVDGLARIEAVVRLWREFDMSEEWIAALLSSMTANPVGYADTEATDWLSDVDQSA